MRLLFVSHSFPPPGRPLANIGGMQRVATELYATLREHPDATVLPLVLETSWRWTHVRIVPYLLRLLRQIPHVAQTERIDGVLFSSMVTAAMAVPLRRRLEGLGVRTAAIVHGRDVTLPVGAYQRLVPRIFGALDAVLPVSRATGEECRRRGLPESKLFVVPNGIHVERFAGAPACTGRRAHLAAMAAAPPLPDGSLLLCSVGRQVERKGFAWFTRHVMPRLPEHVHYWLAGEGPEAEAIRTATREAGVAGRVRLLGHLPEADLERLYRGADLFVMPNVPVPGDMEGFGVVMLEAGLCGLPTVAARLEGIQDVVTEGRNGHLVPSGDADAFVREILRYHHDRRALEEACRWTAEHVADTFDWRRIADRYVQVFRRLQG